MIKNLYFLAILPSKEIGAEINAFKEEVKERFFSSHAMRSPSHITILPPFWLEPEKIPGLQTELEAGIQSLFPIWIKLNNIGKFEPNVLFVQVEENNKLLDCHLTCKKIVENNLSSKMSMNHPFHPHMTIAFKDLDPQLLTKAYDYFQNKNYKAEFKSFRISILQYENGRWNIKN